MLKVLIVYPRQTSVTGNHVTAKRFSTELSKLGKRVRLLPVDPDEHELIRRTIDTWQPDVALLLHALRSGRPWLRATSDVPFAVLLTGTDANLALADELERPTIERVLNQAGAILAQNHDIVRQLAEQSTPAHYLPPGFSGPAEPCDLRRSLGIAATNVLFLHPAGIRPVKGNRALLEIFAPLAAENHPFRLVFCGPVLDELHAQSFFATLSECPWASYAGTLSHPAMLSAMRQADVILNNSLAEGLPNALVEAASLGRPILATAIAGNREVVIDGVNGFSCSSAQEFTDRARQLLLDAPLRQSLCRPAPDRFDPSGEAKKLLHILQGVAAKPA